MRGKKLKGESSYFTVKWEKNSLIVLDQRLLPVREKYLRLKNVMDVFEAIRNMTVRGAPLIGVTAAYGVVLGCLEALKTKKREKIFRAIEILKKSRPTAVNLFWALSRMKNCLDKVKDRPLEEIFERALEEANKIREEDIISNKKIGEHGEKLLKDNWNVLTHCNAGALATAGWGTALGVIRSACERGKRIHVFVDETRPVLQGSRLTAWELMKDGINVTLISDNASAYFMKKGEINCVLVGADRIAMNGDVANKIGTLKLAVLAHYFKIPFYVAAPSSTVDFNISSGEEIPIEERGADEVKKIGNFNIAPKNVEVKNPSFDVTPSELITAIITEKGVIYPPYPENLKKLLP